MNTVENTGDPQKLGRMSSDPAKIPAHFVLRSTQIDLEKQAALKNGT
jgi:hypothetical protein